MANNSEKQTEKILRGYLSQQRQIKERAGCPDEESLAVYLSGNLRGKAKEELGGVSSLLSSRMSHFSIFWSQHFV